jgi:assimilatory nitrate reductase catalytic subunit
VTDFTHPRSSSLTHCPYCAMQCGMVVVKEGERWTVASRDFPANRGRLCRKGWTAAALLDSPDRLTSPLIRDRKDGKLRPTSWDEALDHVVTKFKSIAVRSGANAIGVFGGGGLTNEKAYMLGKFARIALRTAKIDYNGRFCMASAAAAGLRAFGIDRGMPFPMEDIAKAQAVMMIGGNPAETLPVIMQYLEAQREAGGAFVVVDPRRSKTAKLATLHLQLTPGTDSALANGILHVAIQHGLIDRDFIDSRTTGFEAVRRLVSSYWPDRVERMTGVPARQIERAAHILGEAATAMLLTGRGPEQQSQGVNTFWPSSISSWRSARRASGFAVTPH